MSEAISPSSPYELDPSYNNLEGLNRIERALKILNSPKAIRHVNGGLYAVKSQRGLSVYSVEIDNNGNYSCNCPDHIKNGCECKHVLAVKAYLEEKEAKLEHSDAPERDWSSYNLGQMKEGEMFDELLKELVNAVESPKQKSGAGRKSLPFADKMFHAVKKVASMKSLRRNQAGFNESEQDGLVDVSCHYNTISNFMCDPKVTPVLHELIRLSATPLAEIEHEFSIDSSGFRTTQFGTWVDEKYGEHRRHNFLKCHIASGNKTNIISDVVVSEHYGEGSTDTENFPALLEGTAGRFKVREICADPAYVSRQNFAKAEQVGAEPFIYFKENTTGKAKGCPAWTNAFLKFMTHHDEFMEHYGKRNNVESTFGALKAKFGEVLKSKSLVAQKNEILCKVLAYNISMLIEAIFTKDIKVNF